MAPARGQFGDYCYDILIGRMFFSHPAPPGAPRRARRQHDFRPACEPLEPRAMLSAAPASVPGDANGDLVVNGLDVAQVASNWMQFGEAPLAGDTNGDGVVNGLDIATVASHWGQTAVTAFRPEIHLDASDPATVSTVKGGAQFQLAQGQYLTEPENWVLDSLFNNAQKLTIEFQLKQTTLGLDRNFLTRWNYTGQGTLAVSSGLHTGQQDEVAVWFAKPNGTMQAVVVTVAANMQVGKTYDVAVVYDGTQVNPNERVSIYVDGIFQTTYVDQGYVPAALTPSTEALELGRWTGLGRYMDGTLQNVNIWNVAKTQTQIQSTQNDSLTYAQMSPLQRAGLVQSFALTEDGGVCVDAVHGFGMQNPTSVVRENIVTKWTGSGTLPTQFTPSPNGTAPDYVPNSPLNGHGAIAFNGVSDALKYASTVLPNEQSGDVFIVARFTGGGDAFEGDTLFSSSSDTTAVDYFFMASFNAGDVPEYQGGGVPRARLRFRDDAFQTDFRGDSQLLPNVNYVLHYWGLGTGQGYGLTINRLTQWPFYSTSSPSDYNAAAGSWFGAVPNRTNLTIGDFERSDGPQGFAAAYIAEIDVFAGTPAQPILPPDVTAAILDYLMDRYGATALGDDE